VEVEQATRVDRASVGDSRPARVGASNGQTARKDARDPWQMCRAAQLPLESVRRHGRSHVLAAWRPSRLRAARFRAYPAWVVDEHGHRCRPVVVCRCLDPGRQNGQTESPGPDRYLWAPHWVP